MRCAACGHDNPEKRKFCGECRAELVVVCRSCGTSNHPNERVCANCGKPLLREKERRRRVLGAVRALRRRLERVCGAIEHINEIADIARRIGEFLEGTDALEALPEAALERLRDAAEELERLGTRTERLGEVCDKAQKALKYAERLLQPLPAWVGPAAKVGAVAAVVVLGGLMIIGLVVDGDNDDEGEVSATAPTAIPAPRETPGGNAPLPTARPEPTSTSTAPPAMAIPRTTSIPSMVIHGFSIEDLGCAVITSWDVGGDPDGTVELLRDGTSVGSWPIGQDYFTDSPDEEGLVHLEYQLRATNSAGEVVRSDPVSMETFCPPAVPPMVIHDFWVGPDECDVFLDWEVSGDPDGTVELLRNGTPIGSWGIEEDSFTDNLDEQAMFGVVRLEYQLRATNSAGEAVLSEASPIETLCPAPTP